MLALRPSRFMPALRFVLALLVVGLIEVPGAARQTTTARSPENASYSIDARLDPVNRLIYATGRLTWRNIAPVPATELRFHLYWNAWRSPNSTWMRERALAGTPVRALRDEDLALIDVTKLALAGTAPVDLLPRARFISPDDGNAEDRTVLSVPLDRPVAPGETIDVDMSWNAHVPRAVSTAGVIDNTFFVAQWFPKIGVLDANGWNCHQYHAATEFFADFGAYDVRLTVPAGWIVGATGKEVSQTDAGSGATTHRFVERDVHDFAWVTSPSLVEVRDRFAEPGLPAVDLRLLLQPDHRRETERHLTAARATLKLYGQWFGPYPYDHLTIVDPVPIFNEAAQGASTGGMEYPTLVTTGMRWFSPWAGTAPQAVTVHEIGHQFLYGVVATNEVEHAWMDEGINTYAAARVLDETYPDRFVMVNRYFGGLAAWAFDDARWTRIVDGDRLNGLRPFASADSLTTPTWKMRPRAAGVISYNKTALALHTLERVVGWDVMQRILATYYARGSFRHPAPDEFYAIASEVSGQDLTWFFDAAFRSASSFDYRVESVTAIAADQTAPASPAATTISTVVVRRDGDGVFPIDVRVTFDDGSSVTERWDGRERSYAFRYRRGAHVKTVEVDPDRVLLLDLNYTNNSWTAQPHAAAAADRWTLHWIAWLEQVLVTYAFFS